MKAIATGAATVAATIVTIAMLKRFGPAAVRAYL